NRGRPTGYLDSFIRRVSRAVVEFGVTDGALDARVPDRDIRVGADRNRALLRIEAIGLGVVGRRQCDEARKVDTALHDAFREQDRHTGLHARNAIRDVAEAFLALRELLAALVVVLEWAMVGREQVEHTRLDAAPAFFLRSLVAGRRRADELCAFPIHAVEVFCRQHQVLRAGLAEDLEATGAGARNLFHRLTVRYVNDDDRHIRDLGERQRPVGCLALHSGRTGRGVGARRNIASSLVLLDQVADRILV